MQQTLKPSPPPKQISPIRSTVAFLSLAILFLVVVAILHHLLPTRTFLAFDRAVQSSIHTHATPTLTMLAESLSFLGSPRTVWPLTVFLSAGLYLRRPRRPAYLLALNLAAAGTLESLLKLAARRPRSTLPWVYVHEHSYSFPSGHATLAVAFYGILVWLTFRTPHPAWQRTAAILAALVLIPAIGLSRIYLGAHYPTDVLAGYLTGGACLTLIIAADLAL